MAEGNTWMNALIGGVVTLVTVGFVPFSPVLGGAISGYLEGGETSDALRVGVYSGLIALLPMVLLVVLASTLVGVIGIGLGPGAFMPMNGMPWFGASLGAFVVVVFVVVGFVYVVAFSALGSFLGNYVKNETDVDI